MQVSVRGEKIRLGKSLCARLGGGVGKYFDHAVEATVPIARDGEQFHTDCMVHVSAGISAQAHGLAPTVGGSVDAAVERLEKQLRRKKRYLHNHHRRARDSEQIVEPAQPQTRAAKGQGDSPIIIAEAAADLPTLTVSGAARRFGDQSIFFFKNTAHGELNALYRLSDGKLGWVDPINPGSEPQPTKTRRR